MVGDVNGDCKEFCVEHLCCSTSTSMTAQSMAHWQTLRVVSLNWVEICSNRSDSCAKSASRMPSSPSASVDGFLVRTRAICRQIAARAPTVGTNRRERLTHLRHQTCGERVLGDETKTLKFKPSTMCDTPSSRSRRIFFAARMLNEQRLAVQHTNRPIVAAQFLSRFDLRCLR